MSEGKSHDEQIAANRQEREPITEERLPELQTPGWEWPRTFEEIAAWVEAGRDIGWHAEQFLVDEVRRLRSV